MSIPVFQTDIAIIGAGPVGLFAVFQAGMLGMKAHIIDSLPHIGGQCAALYPDKPIYDIPAYSQISGQNLIDSLAKQAEPFKPVYHLGQQVTAVSGDAATGFTIITATGVKIQSKVVVIAAGAGAFMPNRPALKHLSDYENQSVFYAVKNKQDFAGKKIVIAGGGDSAADWVIELQKIAQKVYFIHRRESFKAHDDTIKKLYALKDQGLIAWHIPAQLASLEGENGILQAVIIKNDNGDLQRLEADILLPFYGLSMQLGPIATWGLGVSKNHLTVESASMETNIRGIYAIGDIATYGHKLKLILTGFAEAATAIHHAYGTVFPDKPLHFSYSTDKGILHV